MKRIGTQILMPQPGEALPAQPSTEDSYLELVAETLEGLEEAARGQFLRQFFRTMAHMELTEAQANESWERILARRRELSDSAGKRISLKSAIVDVLASMSSLRVPILIEYEEFKKLQINAATDPLTGLYNRRLFDESFDKELNRAKRYGQHLAVVIMDLHKLKEVNDRFGHLQGDHVLQLAASTLRKTLRASDFAFRIGGDEFALLLPQTDPEQAITLCRRVRSQYETELRPLKLEIGVTLDFGVAVQPIDADSRRSLLRIADERLYHLKNASRGNGPRAVPSETQAQHEAPPYAAPQAATHATIGPLSPATAAAGTPTHREAAPPASIPQSRETLPHPGDRPAVPLTPDASVAAAASAPSSFTVQRRWERVSLAGTKAHAVLSEVPGTASVIDLSYGGVALLLEDPQAIPDVFNAVLHVPILPPVRVSLKKTYVVPLERGRARVGCAFVS